MQSFRRGPNARGDSAYPESARAISAGVHVSRLETNNRKVHRFGRANRIEILAEKYDLAVGGTQKDYVILSIDASGKFDASLRFDLCDCA